MNTTESDNDDVSGGGGGGGDGMGGGGGDNVTDGGADNETAGGDGMGGGGTGGGGTGGDTVIDNPMGPSDGPSDGPARLLGGEYGSEEYDSERQLTASSNSSNSTEVSDGVAISAAECICPDPVPEVMTSFVSTLSFADPAELADFDLEAMKNSLTASEEWGDSEVVATAVFKLMITYTLPAGTEVTNEQCAAGFRAVYSVPAANDVTCSEASTGNATDRRLQDAVVLDVDISYPDAMAASTAATDVSGMTEADLISNLAGAGVTVATISQTAPTVDVEISWVVTGESTVAAPMADDFIAAAGDDVTVTVEVSEAMVTYASMPCSVGLESESCPSGMSPIAEPSTVGCLADTCDLADADTQCCGAASPSTTSGAYTNTQALGSLMVVFPVVWLCL